MTIEGLKLVVSFPIDGAKNIGEIQQIAKRHIEQLGLDPDIGVFDYDVTPFAGTMESKVPLSWRAEGHLA